MKSILAVLMVAVISSGCVSGAVAYKNSMQHVVSARPLAGGQGAALGVDILGLTGAYWQAWKDAPGSMAGATAVDVALGYAMYAAGQAQGKKESTTVNEAQTLPSQINAQNVIIGDGNQINQQGE